MSHIENLLVAISVVLLVVIGGCSSDEGSAETPGSDRPTATWGEHDRERGEHDGEGWGEHDRDGGEHGEEGEESGTELGLLETYNKVRNGVRLTLAYDAHSNSFHGTVENTTDRILRRVRVEVHLSNGTELGPTTPTDLGPGETRDVRLEAASKGFYGWTAHPEVGGDEHSRGEEDGEHR